MTLLVVMIIAILICFCLVMCYDCNRFVIVAYEWKSKKITKEYTFVLLSDLHNKSFGRGNEKLLLKIEELSPDGILTAGDMLTAQKDGRSYVAAELMERLAAKYPVYYGMGNHEHRMKVSPEEFENQYESYRERLFRAGIEPLINESVSLPSANIRISGLQMDGCYYRKFRKYLMPESYLTDILGQPQEDAFQILIAHNPEYFEDYARWGADLVVSGHVHGGLMRLPFLGGVVSPKLTLFPKYDGGQFECGDSVMVLSRGLGTHTLPIRIFNPGELVTIHLQPADAESKQ